MRKLSAKLLAVALIFFFQTMVSNALPPAITKKIPGQFSDTIDKGSKYQLQATKAGKYLFQYSERNAKKKAEKIPANTEFNNVKIVLRNGAGAEVGSNYYPAIEGISRQHYGDYFVVNLNEPQLLQLELSPLSAVASTQSFTLIIDIITPKTMIMGIKLSNFLMMIAALALLSAIIFFYRLIIKPLKNMNVQDIKKRGEILRAARQQAAAEITDRTDSSDKNVGKTDASSFCGKCGLSREEDADFCGECGSRFED